MLIGCSAKKVQYFALKQLCFINRANKNCPVNHGLM